MSELSPTTQLAILLTARWAVNGSQPLANAEFLEFRRRLGASQDSASSLLLGERPLADFSLDPMRLQGLLNRGLGVFQAIDRWLQAGLWVVSLADIGYPARFKQLKHRAPILLFGYGDPNAFSSRALAIVGSRNASEERLNKAAEVGRACSKTGITVVSGGAKGVDAAAMQAGIVENGTVVGVLADSLLRESGKKVYRDAIVEKRLCLMSEVHPEAKFEVGNAMARNRLAYACADATLVIECDPNKGGTWAGAIEALREGKAVYVLRGARAQKQLAEKGAIEIDIDFALDPQRLIAGNRPAGAERARSCVDRTVAELVGRAGGTKRGLAQLLQSYASEIAESLFESALSDGEVAEGSHAGGNDLPVSRRSESSKVGAQVESLFGSEAR